MIEMTVLVLVVCLGLGSALSTLHACLNELTRATLEELAEGAGRRRRAQVQRILDDQEGHARGLAMIRIACNLAATITAVFLVAALRGASAPDWRDGVIGMVVATIALWVFTVSLPESVAKHAAERVILAAAPLVRALSLVQRPLTPAVRAVDAVIARFSGQQPDKQTEVADELISIAEQGEREGVLDEGERRMIEAVVNFKNRTVEQIMTPRNEVEALELSSNLGAITAFVRKARHSRVPVYRTGGSLDDVVGFFYVKDLLRWLAGEGVRGHGGTGGGFDLKQILRPAIWVPKTKTVRALAEELVEKKVHIAVVADEYGQMTGVVSLEDIIEEVFGEIQDEYEKTEDEPPRIEVKPEDRLADVDARAYVDDVNQAVRGLGIEIPESDDYDTLGGFVLSTLGHIPEVNETFNHGTMTVTVLESSPTRVLKVRLLAQRPELEPESEQATPARAEGK